MLFFIILCVYLQILNIFHLLLIDWYALKVRQELGKFHCTMTSCTRLYSTPFRGMLIFYLSWIPQFNFLKALLLLFRCAVTLAAALKPIQLFQCTHPEHFLASDSMRNLPVHAQVCLRARPPTWFHLRSIRVVVQKPHVYIVPLDERHHIRRFAFLALPRGQHRR